MSARNAYDHKELGSKLIFVLNDYLLKHGINYKAPEPVVINRFTYEEFDQIKAFSLGEVFYHVNLQHYGIPKELLNIKYQLGTKIIKHGKIYPNGTRIAPQIDTQNYLILEQLNLEYSLPISESETSQNLILHDNKGIFESIFKKYQKSLGYTKDTIYKMHYFSRSFKIIDRITI